MDIGMHCPLFRQKTNHIDHGAQLCAYFTVVILNIRVTKYLPLGISSWQPTLRRGILLSRWSSVSFNRVIRYWTCSNVQLNRTISYLFTIPAGGTPNPHYLMRRDNNSSDVALSTHLTDLNVYLLRKHLHTKLSKSQQILPSKRGRNKLDALKTQWSFSSKKDQVDTTREEQAFQIKKNKLHLHLAAELQKWKRKPNEMDKISCLLFCFLNCFFNNLEAPSSLCKMLRKRALGRSTLTQRGL